jgi:hypothetical protein
MNMSDLPSIRNKFVVVAITQDEARVWNTGLEKGAHPERIYAPDEKGTHHHIRQAQHKGGHGSDPAERGFFDLLAREIVQAAEILLIGHGAGKANAMLRFTQYMERHNPDVAKKVIGAVDADLNALSENQILAKARDWFDWYHREGSTITTTMR